jgi:hypothetical protein
MRIHADPDPLHCKKVFFFFVVLVFAKLLCGTVRYKEWKVLVPSFELGCWDVNEES